MLNSCDSGLDVVRFEEVVLDDLVLVGVAVFTGFWAKDKGAVMVMAQKHIKLIKRGRLMGPRY
jgi:hypothetical protein